MNESAQHLPIVRCCNSPSIASVPANLGARTVAAKFQHCLIYCVSETVERKILINGKILHPEWRSVMGVTRQLADFVADTSYDRLPEDVKKIAKMCILDTLAAIVCGRESQTADVVIGLVRGLGGVRESSVLGEGLKTSCVNAALANGVMSHVMELDDAHRDSFTHTGAVVVPAALAMAEREGAGGKDVILSTVLGYEVVARIGRAGGKSHYNRWHATSTIGCFGSAVAAGKILDLKGEDMVNNLGLAGTQAGGLWESLMERAIAGSKHFHAGKAASNGVMAALLAEKGLAGSDRIVEGEKGLLRVTSDATDDDMAQIADGLGTRYIGMLNNAFKPHACCFSTHAPIDMTLETVNKYGLRSDSVEEITVSTDPASMPWLRWLVGNPDPKDEFQARFSIPYTVALAVLKGRVGPHEFRKELLNNGTIRELMGRVRLEEDPSIEKGGPGGAWKMIKLRIRTKDGKEFDNSVTAAKAWPMTAEQIPQKFRAVTEEVLSQQQIKRVIDVIEALEKKKDVSELVESLVIRKQMRRIPAIRAKRCA